MIHKIISLSTILAISACTMNNRDETQVLSVNRVVDKTDTSSKICESFYLTENEIITYFQEAKQISNEKDHSESLILPCKYEGKIKMENKIYSYEIFAGGTGYFYDENGWAVKNFICSNNKCCALFSTLC